MLVIFEAVRLSRVVVSQLPAVPHHVVEVDILFDDCAVTHVVVEEFGLGDSLALPVAVNRVAVGARIPEVVDEALQHLTLCPVAVCELRMFDVVVCRLKMAHGQLILRSSVS